jgi:hypothetical protein
MESKQDREDRITARILSVGALGISAFLVVVLMFRGIPSQNEILLGTVVGFIFGNMVGPVFRKAFGGIDSDTRKAQVAQGEALSSAVSGLASSAPMTDKPLPVTVANKPDNPVPVEGEVP